MAQKVLLVDDDPLMHLLYKQHLEAAGYQMLAAEDGTGALELAVREMPQVIVMDVFMPQMNGLEVLSALKKNEATKAIPVIIITAQVGHHDTFRKEATRSGAALFLTKPFSPSQLLGAIRQVPP